MYISMKNRPQRLGSLEREPRFGNLGDFGQSDTASGIISAIGSAVNGIVTSITNSKVLIAESKDKANVAIITTEENTKKLQIATEGQVQEASIAVDQTTASYSGITKVVLGSGAVLAVVLIAAAYSYSIASDARGSYEVEYQTA